MPISRAQKAARIETLDGMLNSSETVVVVHNMGLTVAQMTELRVQLRANGANLKVTKNRLAQRALKGTRFEGLTDLMKGPTAIAVSKDPVAAAKAVFDFAKSSNDKLVILGGAMGDKVLDVASVEALAQLPSLDSLRGKIVGLLQAPATKIARVLQAPAQAMVQVTKAYSEKAA